MAVNPSLLEFLKNKRTIFANYQPIVIKLLLEKGVNENFSASLDEIREKIILLNFDREDFQIKNAIDAVLPALKNYVFEKEGSVSLDIDSFSDDEIDECLKICNKEIGKRHVTKIMKDENEVYVIQAGLNGIWLEEFQNSKSVGVGYSDVGGTFDLTNKTKDEINDKTNGKGVDELYNISQIKKGDIIAIRSERKGLTSFGIATSDYFFDSESKTYNHKVNVEYLNFGTTEIDGKVSKAIFKPKKLREAIKDFLSQEKYNYFILRHNPDSPWDDVDGNKYHFGKNVPNQKKLRNAGINTRTIWYTKQNGYYYFWGYGVVKEIETIQENEEWNLTYDDFTFFEKQENSLELDGKFLKLGTDLIQNQIENVPNFNNQHAMTQITKKIYDQITGDTSNVSDSKVQKHPYQKFFDMLIEKKQFFFYGPPGTGKTFTAKEIAREFIKESQTKSFTDEQYNEYVLSMINKVSRENGFVFEKQSENYLILKNSEKEIRIYINYSKSGKNIPHDCYVGISGSVVNFLSQTDDENRFILIINNDVKNFVLIPHSFIIKNVKLSGGENWDSTGDSDHSFHIHVYGDHAQFRANNNYTENYVSCTNYLSNIQILFNKNGKSCNQLEKITFHQSFSYEEFIEGIRPKTDEKINQITYPIEEGIFKRLCKCADIHDKENFVLIIDEINRGNISKIFGELITLLENDKRGDTVTLPYSKKLFSVPPNLYIIGTMNTADRSLVHIDAALKRRFAQVELMPNSEMLNAKVGRVHLGKLLDNLNQKIIDAKFRDNQIGHSYFMKNANPITTVKELQFAFVYDIVPLLKDYFYDDDKILNIVLGHEFIDNDRNILSEWTENESVFMKVLEKAYSEAFD